MKMVKMVKTLPVLAALMICSALLFTTCGLGDVIKKWLAETSEPGVYVGVLSFAQGSEPDWGVKDLVFNQANKELTIPLKISATDPSLVYLDSENLASIKDNVLNDYVPGNTNGRPLVYAVDRAIQNLTNYIDSLNDKLDNITIISFSSGTDQGSGAALNQGNTLAEYGKYVKSRIDTPIIRNRDRKEFPINAWAIAVKASNATLQEQTLKYISSGDDSVGYNYKITETLNDTDLKNIFDSIGLSLTSIQTSASLTLTVNDPSSFIMDDSTLENSSYNFLAVFDGKDPSQSTKYIKGKILNSDGIWKISNLSFTGLTSSLQEVIQSGKNGSYVDFGFPGLSGIGSGTSLAEYMYTTEGWFKMSGEDNKVVITVRPAEKKTAIIFLVLDATLSNNDLIKVRNAASNFITLLYAESNK